MFECNYLSAAFWFEYGIDTEILFLFFYGIGVITTLRL